MLAIGAGSLGITVATGVGPFYLTYPKVIKINLLGRLLAWVSAEDVILKVLEVFTTKGNGGCIFEYGGEAMSTLTVRERATLANMGTECGFTTSTFPSGGMSWLFLKAQQRDGNWVEIKADADAECDRVVDIDLSKLVPLAAIPHSPENIQTVKDIGEIEGGQLCIGSCTNSSYNDLVTIAKIIKDKVVHPRVSFIVAPGLRQGLENPSTDGYLTELISAGTRIAECACTFCSGNSYSPSIGSVSLRTSNRNYLRG
jgi:aconitate hydratase